MYRMSREQKNNHPHPHTPPHKSLGRYLKTMRQKLQESLGETSGAVEIDVEQLDRFERGAELPSEDILLLLISHFGLQDDEAVTMWELAGYDHGSAFSPGHDNGGRGGQGASDDGFVRAGAPIMLLALDNRVLYSNGVDIVSDDAGMVLNFVQSADQNQRIPVSRIGMSHEQAEQLLLTLQRALLHKKYLSGPKRLPPPAE